ncbi:hypothetical protein SARC_09040 [Sphaeroforma arctica JP610]|uniref:Uncharacterized protein n=1 Tax=Sphaeroforma arctica JP610 TaxID=667725 RepID=A0A0L0FPU7_9EUKA|nr:hypothetical protein SARC_09040 [Sphaeroforma arctica JP610]KNC78536.1 hypothetical protein SARC_09040 [Sphaeroforma arctica JP610]|eukprot:XP_014152438.1 hypothetical protein SARC_09040 [Sphaeroforma arctica JP610]
MSGASTSQQHNRTLQWYALDNEGWRFAVALDTCTTVRCQDNVPPPRGLLEPPVVTPIGIKGRNPES